ncbi:MAG TPA: hypothetical protein VH083_05235, partial [Myxococcales bacterium]|nr:hypothetical protein [Myxococcales bacterium]
MARIFRMKPIARSRFRADSRPRRPIQPPSLACRTVVLATRFRNPKDIDFRARQWRNDRFKAFPGGGMFTGVKVFSATKAKERDDLGEQVTR